jgi:hypothetical protein
MGTVFGTQYQAQRSGWVTVGWNGTTLQIQHQPCGVQHQPSYDRLLLVLNRLDGIELFSSSFIKVPVGCVCVVTRLLQMQASHAIQQDGCFTCPVLNISIVVALLSWARMTRWVSLAQASLLQCQKGTPLVWHK